ncbi:voltage-dependent potassium channel, beta subunit [Syncephalis plumigaleata]|nr:voltage-dependent potassium channel, beta subunit [Syncephalis plumigaleata]
MEYRHLGSSGLKVSVLSLGGWLTYGGQTDEDGTYECMKRAYELGVNFFDTAEVYADGQSEIVMGNVIKRCGWKRSDIVISTKLFWGGKGPNDRGLSRKHIIEGLDASLKRLQLDYVDIVFAHRPDPETPMEEVVRAFNHVINQGKAFYWGTSEWSAEELSEAYGIADRLNLIGPTVEQPQYNMFERERVEKEYDPLYKKRGLGTTIWSPLASGVLTGKYNKGIPSDSRLAGQGDMSKILRGGLESEKGRKRIEKVDKLLSLAEQLGCTCAQLALAWCAKNPHISTVITGASRTSQVEENIKALEVLPKLTPEIMLEIDVILGNKPAPVVNYRN